MTTPLPMPTDQPQAPRPFGIWVYAALLLMAGGLHLGIASFLLASVGHAPSMWFAIGFILGLVLIGSLLGALGIGLWRGVSLAWWSACGLFAGASIYSLALCIHQIASLRGAGLPVQSGAISWRWLLLMAFSLGYLFLGQRVRRFYGIDLAKQRLWWLRLLGCILLGLVVVGVAQLLALVSLILFR